MLIFFLPSSVLLSRATITALLVLCIISTMFSEYSSTTFVFQKESQWLTEPFIALFRYGIGSCLLVSMYPGGHFQLLATAKCQYCRDHIVVKCSPGNEIWIAPTFFWSHLFPYDWVPRDAYGGVELLVRRQVHIFIICCQTCHQSSDRKWKHLFL